MPSGSLTVFPGFPHHVTQRGYRHREIVLDEDDCGRFIDLAAAETANAGARVWAYALMTNHVHLILVPEERTSIAAAIDGIRRRYEQAFHERHGPPGALWQPRFYASVLDRQEFLWRAVRYVERNPVEAGMVFAAEDYPWSSAPWHCGQRSSDPLVSPDSPLRGAIEDWSRWLAEPDPRPVMRTGPSSRFVSRLEYLRGKKGLRQKRRGGAP